MLNPLLKIKLLSYAKSLLILLLIFLTVLLVDYVFLHILLPNKRMEQHPTLDVPFIKNERN